MTTDIHPLEKVLQLPEVVPAEEKQLPPYLNEAPNTALLHHDQLPAYNKMLDFIQRPYGGMFLLEGYAGTGKTFTISMLVQHFLFHKKGQGVCMTAPTNKAVKILRKAATFSHSNLDYRTIHSLLGLRERIDYKTGEINFVPDPTAETSLNDIALLIVDEVSMLNDELFEMLEPVTRERGLKIIFMGDPCQIPPVKADDPIPFQEDQRSRYGIERATLETVVRQAEDNPILAATMRIRKAIHRPITFPSRDTELDEAGNGIMFMGRREDEIKNLLRVYFTSENFKEDSDFAKVIAWTNRTVDAYNGIIRQYIYGKDAGKIELGEQLVLNAPVVKNEVVHFRNNDEVTVLEIGERMEEIDPANDISIKCYRVKVKNNDTGFEDYISILHEEGEDRFKKIKSYLLKRAKKEQDPFVRGGHWREYYAFIRMFADVKYNYAVTAHKSQGSTYDNVIMIESDIDKNRKVTERNRIKYVGCSRPRFRLFIVG